MKRLLVSAAISLSLAAPVAAQDASTVLATVNGTDITLGHLIAMRAMLPAQYQELPDEVLYNGMLDQLIQQEVVADSLRGSEDARTKLTMENEDRAFLASVAIDAIAFDTIADADVQALYDANFADAGGDLEWNASHILVATEEEAQNLIDQLNDGADFVALAQEFSTGPSGPNGGALGWFGTGMMVPEFETAVADLEAGEISAPVQTQFGWHVVKLNESRISAPPAPEDVRADLEEELRRQRVDAYLAELTEAAEITRPEVEIDMSLIRNIDLLTQ
ncbi:MAG: peptidylprolyl isomerase [Rhodobacteraceae bacterium]|jgi:peptidyl-prolyl cis-trans isomerase C|uniref:peptidylprolyl isomerase n=1 Tax=Roseovarius sp. 10 TaxID=3080563 RepID=UPI0019E2A848|nr:peptidylprolyl isomerase [Roseovarius sp. 10]MBE1289801.1 peptidylprolyl isomerase [Paracoccaceae bacterium]MDV7201942.1 peptidylprolyl isomerase [Roseovarius sp. 10]